MTTHHTTWPMATPPPFTQNAPRSQTMADRVGLTPSSILSQCPWKLAAVPLVLCPFLLLLIRPSPGDGSSFSSSTVRASGTPVFPPPGSLFSLSTFPVTSSPAPWRTNQRKWNPWRRSWWCVASHPVVGIVLTHRPGSGFLFHGRGLWNGSPGFPIVSAL